MNAQDVLSNESAPRAIDRRRDLDLSRSCVRVDYPPLTRISTDGERRDPTAEYANRLMLARYQFRRNDLHVRGVSESGRRMR